MCAYTHLENKYKKKIPQGGCATPPNVPPELRIPQKLTKIDASHVAYR